jgi:hypothetical protein
LLRNLAKQAQIRLGSALPQAVRVQKRYSIVKSPVVALDALALAFRN